MSPGLPAMDPAFVAATVEALPGRLQKRLDQADPSSWEVDGPVVRHGTATVTLDPPGAAICDCLLAPRCLHLAQVLLACPADTAAETAEAGEPPAPPEPDPAAEEPAEAPPGLDDDALTVLARAEACLVGLLDRGLGGLTAADRAALLRVVAGARVHRLPRLAAAYASLHGRLGDQVTEAAVDALTEAALATHRLRHGHENHTLEVDDLGTARRRYEPVGTLRLRGWACEPVLTSSGYAGVVTHLVDERDGGVWTLSSVLPGGEDGVTGAYRGGTGLPELAASHRELVRSGLLLTRATASADRRLGRGGGVRANQRQPDESAVPGEGWWQGSVVLQGFEADGTHPVLVCESADGPLRCGITEAAQRLGQPALKVLARAPGTEVAVRLRARRPDEAGRSAWVLLGVCHDDEWVFPGLDRPDTHWLGAPQDGEPLPVPSAGVEPATVLRRWRDAMARQGRRAVTGPARTRLEADAAWLRSRASGHRAELLLRLAAAAEAGDRAFDGSFRADPSGLPRAWTALALVC